MRKLIRPIHYFFAGLLCITTGGFAQSVGIGTSTPDASARLEVNSSSQGILVPRLTSAERSAISSPATGLLVFQTDGTPGFYYYSGVAWVNLTNGYAANSNGIAVSSNYGFTSTLAGNGSTTSVDGTGTAASFYRPNGVATDASGNVYVVEISSHKIRKITPAGVVTTLAGDGSAGAVDGTGTGASFYNPWGVATDLSGNVYVADTYNHKIRKITPSGIVSTLAGSGTEGSADGTGTAASFRYPAAVATDASGNVYVADGDNSRIRKITPSGEVTTLAGSFNRPYGVATDAAGNVYVADTYNHRIRKITPSGVVTTLAGSGTQGSTDGIGTAASFNTPAGIATDASGNVYIGEPFNNKIRKITPSGVVTTLSGSGAQGQSDGAATTASFNLPMGVATDASGNVYVADRNNHKIRKIIAQ